MLFKDGSGLVKAATDGTAEIVFATLDVVDKDGDITLPGAFGRQTAKISPAHDWTAPGMGKAEIFERENEAVARLSFNLKMASGREWAESIKYNFDNQIAQEYSYGFDVMGETKIERDGQIFRGLSDQKVYEVSPVMVGAGVGTRTISAKASRTLESHFADVVAQNRDFHARLADLRAKRSENGRSLSQTNRERLKQLIAELSDITAQAGELITVPATDDAAISALLLEIESGQLARMGA